MKTLRTQKFQEISIEFLQKILLYSITKSKVLGNFCVRNVFNLRYDPNLHQMIADLGIPLCWALVDSGEMNKYNGRNRFKNYPPKVVLMNQHRDYIFHMLMPFESGMWGKGEWDWCISIGGEWDWCIVKRDRWMINKQWYISIKSLHIIEFICQRSQL